MRFKNFKYLLFILGIFFVISPAEAAELKLETNAPNVKTGEIFFVDIYINSDSDINAVEGSLIYPEETLNIYKINDGESVLNFWVEKPHLVRDGELRFAGVTPGGFKGNNLKILSLAFKGLKPQTVNINLDNIKIFKNDGLGSEELATWQSISLDVSDQGQYIQQPQAYDLEAPEPFSPEIARDSSLFNGRWFLVFSTQDKGQGLAYFEVKEAPFKFLESFTAWHRVSSPYILEDQKLQSYIWVRAIDKSGNQKLATLNPQNKFQWYQYLLFFAIITGAVILILGRILSRSWPKQKRKIK